jgi:hypothetical protein
MSFEPLLIYVLAALLIVIGLRKRSNSLRAGKIIGNVVVGDISGTINQSYTQTRATEASPAPPDRTAWAIGIVGVLIASAQLAHDVFWGK